MRDVYRSTAGLSISLRDYRRLAGRWERALNQLIAAFGDEQRPVGRGAHPDLRSAGRPVHLDAIDLFRLADAEVERERTLGVVASAAYDVGDLLAAAGFDGASRSDGAAVGPRTGQRERNCVLPRADVLQQRGPIVHVHDEDLGSAVAIEIAGCQPAGGTGRVETGAGFGGNVCEVPVAQVVVEQRLLPVAFADGRTIDFGIDVPVGQHQIGPTVLVDIQKSGAPAEQLILS